VIAVLRAPTYRVFLCRLKYSTPERLTTDWIPGGTHLALCVERDAAFGVLKRGFGDEEGRIPFLHFVGMPLFS